MSLHTSTVNQVLTTAERIGASVPKNIVKEWQKLVESQEKVRNLSLGDTNIARAVVAALSAGKDPTTDPDVQRTVIANAIGSVSNYGLGGAIDDLMHEFISEHGAEILDSFAAPFDKAAATINRCLDTLGDVALEDTAAILSKRGDSAQVWADAQAADKVIGEIEKVWKLFKVVAQVGLDDRRYRLLIIADVPAKVFVAEQLGSAQTAQMRPWDVARRGWRLSLATTTTIHERIGAITGEHQQREVHAEGAFSQEYRRTRGDGLVAR